MRRKRASTAGLDPGRRRRHRPAGARLQVAEIYLKPAGHLLVNHSILINLTSQSDRSTTCTGQPGAELLLVNQLYIRGEPSE